MATPGTLNAKFLHSKTTFSAVCLKVGSRVERKQISLPPVQFMMSVVKAVACDRSNSSFVCVFP